jgi:hypothetical protein
MIENAGQDEAKESPCILLVGMQVGIAIIENMVEIPPKIKNIQQ